MRRLRTATTPRVTRVSVPSQRSTTCQIVPRTVAELLRPRARKRPLPLPHSLRTVRVAAVRATAPRAVARGQRLKSPPTRRSSVTIVAAGAWVTANLPPEKSAVCVAPAEVAAAVSVSVPFVVSTTLPVGRGRDGSIGA